MRQTHARTCPSPVHTSRNSPTGLSSACPVRSLQYTWCARYDSLSRRMLPSPFSATARAAVSVVVHVQQRPCRRSRLARLGGRTGRKIKAIHVAATKLVIKRASLLLPLTCTPPRRSPLRRGCTCTCIYRRVGSILQIALACASSAFSSLGHSLHSTVSAANRRHARVLRVLWPPLFLVFTALCCCSY